jgi:lipoprotein NlpD
MLAFGLSSACVQPHRGLFPVENASRPPSEHRELWTDTRTDSQDSRPADSGSSGGTRHRVSAGENLYRIALKYDVSVSALMKANGIDDVRQLKVGQELNIPGVVTRTAEVSSVVAPIVVSSSSATRGDDDVEDPREMRGGGGGVPKETFGRGPLSWPLRGVLYGRFGKRGKEVHDGVDLAAPLGTPVKTAAPGKVLFAGEQRGYGLIAVVEHADGLVTLYAHNHDLRVKTGQKVREGQVISTVGESGKTSGPHLHFEVRERGRPVDPLPKLGPAPKG